MAAVPPRLEKTPPRMLFSTCDRSSICCRKRNKHLQSQIDEQHEIARKNATTNKNAAKAALRRKKANEHTQEQTLAQIQTLETQINSIESANINHETLLAMQQAGKAMKQIHGKLTPEKVDQTMDELREQNALSDEIVNAITNNPIGDPIDDDELEAELDELQQEKLDEDILKTGSVPVTDIVQRMPSVANQEPVSDRAQAEKEDDEEAELRKLQAEMAM